MRRSFLYVLCSLFIISSVSALSTYELNVTTCAQGSGTNCTATERDNLNIDDTNLGLTVAKAQSGQTTAWTDPPSGSNGSIENVIMTFRHDGNAGITNSWTIPIGGLGDEPFPEYCVLSTAHVTTDTTIVFNLSDSGTCSDNVWTEDELTDLHINYDSGDGKSSTDAFITYVSINFSYNAIPYFSVDLNSNATVDVGQNITFNATGIDPEGDSYNLTVCSTDSFSSGSCTATEYCQSSTVSNGSVATCDYLVTASGSLTGYGFLCDDQGSCNSTSTNSTTTVNAIYGDIHINLTNPLATLDVNITDQFYINANVSCVGPQYSECGDVSARPRYNGSSANPDTFITVTGTPFVSILPTTYDVMNSEGDGSWESSTDFRGDLASNEWYNETLIYFTPDKNMTIKDQISIEQARLGFLSSNRYNFSICDLDNPATQSYSNCALMVSDLATSFSDGQQNIFLTGSKEVIANQNYTLQVLWSSGTQTDNDGATDRTFVRYDNSSTENRIHAALNGSSYTSTAGYANITFYGDGSEGETVETQTLLQGQSFNASFLIEASEIGPSEYYIDVYANSSLGSGNVPDNDSVNQLVKINVTVGGGGNSTTFTVELPFGYVDINFSANQKTTSDLEADGQNNTNGVMTITNNGDVSLDVFLEVNATASGFVVFGDTDNNPTGATVLTATAQQLITALATSASQDVWMWVNWTDKTPQTVGRELNVSVQQN